MQFAPDTARVFIAAARAASDGARAFNLGGPASTLAEAARAIEAAAPGVTIGVDEQTILPFPEEFDGAPLETAIEPIAWTQLADGVRQTVDRLRAAQG
jgi:nucleoside-diphosphate-sugar epimerase